MDGFSYHNIFDTKGIEYLAIIAFFLVLLPFWLLLNKQVTNRISNAFRSLSASLSIIPQGIFYSRNHTWAHLERNGIAKIGLNGLLTHITGEVHLRQMKNPGEQIAKGDLLAEIDQNGKSLLIYSPISGTVVRSNHDLNEDQKLLHDDPYGRGWIYSIKPTDWKLETNSCLLAEEASEWLKVELIRYKDFLAMNLNDPSNLGALIVLQDGGEISENSLSAMPDKVWHDFQYEFLNSVG